MARRRKIRAFDGAGFWEDSFRDGHIRLLRLAGVPEDRLGELADRRYAELPEDLRYGIETGGITRADL